MFLEFNFIEQFEKMDNYCKDLLFKVLVDILLSSKVVLYVLFEDLYEVEENQGLVFFLEEGIVVYQQENKIFFYYDVGDFIGMLQWGGMPIAKYYIEFLVILVFYNCEVLW